MARLSGRRRAGAGLDEVRLATRTVLWVVCGLALVSLPHLFRLPGWLAVLLPGLWIWRVLALARRLPLPTRPLLAVLTGTGTAAVLLNFGVLWGRDAGVALLNLMLGLKLLEIRVVRDAHVAVLLALFVAITHFLYSQSMGMVAYTLVVLLALVVVMIAIEQRQGTGLDGTRVAGRVGLAVQLLIQAVPLAVVLFLFFPRLSGPLWTVSVGDGRGVSGLSETMAPGAISGLIPSDAVAFRVKMLRELSPAQPLYWRGPVFSFFDGRTWQRGAHPTRAVHRPEVPGIGRSGPRVDHWVIMEPHGRRWVFALDLPVVAPPGTAIAEDYQVLAERRIDHRQRFLLSSYLGYTTPSLADREWYQALQLPVHVGAQTKGLAQTWRRAASSGEEVVARALEHFRAQPFVYTLDPPLLGADPVEEFLFETRAGFCEHFSSAFTVLMRLTGIPARVVTGYLGGERNPLDDHLIVRQSDAHAWSEVWLQGRGWTRVDPTAAVAPQRIVRRVDAVASSVEGTVRFSVPLDGPLGALVERLRYGWDAAHNGWNQWVLGYDHKRQEEMLQRLGVTPPQWQGVNGLFPVAIATVLAATAALVLARRRREDDPVARNYRRFCERLAGVGLGRQMHEGPLEFSRRLSKERPELAPSIGRITALYIALRYGREGGSVREFERLVRGFRPRTRYRAAERGVAALRRWTA